MDIDTTGFELGMPTKLEMLEQHSLLLQAEYEQAADALSKARTDIRHLIEMLDNANRRRGEPMRVCAKAEYLLTDFRAENARLETRIEEARKEIRRLKRKLIEATPR